MILPPLVFPDVGFVIFMAYQVFTGFLWDQPVFSSAILYFLVIWKLISTFLRKKYIFKEKTHF
jgi:hypothetical protein